MIVLVVALHRWYTNVSRTKGDKKHPPKIYYFRQHKEVWLSQGLWLITMATLLMVTLLPRSAGRHHRTKLREDGEGLGDWGWRKLSLQTVVCNALLESRSPRTVRQGINQAHARDQESSLCCHTLPPSPPVIDWCSLSINLSFFSVISCLQSYHGLKGDRYCEPGTRIMSQVQQLWLWR